MSLTSGLIGGLVAAVLVPVIAVIVNRRRPGAPPRNTLRQSNIVIGVYLACVLFFGAVFVITTFFVPRSDNNPWWVAPVFFAFALVGAIAAYVSLVSRASWTDEIITVHGIRGERSLRWDQLVSVTYNPFMQSWKVRPLEGQGFSVSSLAVGARDFLEEAAARGILAGVDIEPEPES